jgi:uncharacterized membrane protein
LAEQILGFPERAGRALSLGPEILVAATIVKTTTVDPSPKALGMLAIMIGIRTMLSWAMVLEMTGRWPWQQAAADPPE